MLGFGSPDVRVVVIDSGVTEVLELQGRVDSGVDYYGDFDTSDQADHGTRVASVIAASTNNGVGIAGVAPRVHIVPLRACHGFGTPENFVPVCVEDFVTSALDWALTEAIRGSVHVVNMSIGQDSFNNTWEGYLEDLHNLDVFIAASAGNDGGNSIDYPARSQYVTAVGGIDEDGSRHSESNYGAGLDAVAPYETWRSTRTETPNIPRVPRRQRRSSLA